MDSREINICDMTLLDIKNELYRLACLIKESDKNKTFENLDRAQDLVDEITYRQIYQPKGISRFQAGQIMFYGG
jgi:hypothetical protein